MNNFFFRNDSVSSEDEILRELPSVYRHTKAAGFVARTE